MNNVYFVQISPHTLWENWSTDYHYKYNPEKALEEINLYESDKLKYTEEKMAKSKVGAFFPYTVGLLWSYAKTFDFVTDNYEHKETFLFREPLVKILERIEKPSVIAASCYIWNLNFNLSILKAVKELYPECTTVVGGPSIPYNDKTFFEQRPYIDVAATQEGEQVFVDVLKENLNGKHFDNVKGVYTNNIFTEKQARIDDINKIPSPYLTGEFDKFVKENPNTYFAAIYETDRGCPFKCTFCDWGNLTHQKVKLYDINRSKAEVDWMAENNVNAVWFANANLGMFRKRDIDIVDHIEQTYYETGQVSNIFVTGFSKTPPEKSGVREIQEKLFNIETHDKRRENSLRDRAKLSIQSFDENILEIIKRKNLEVDYQRLLRDTHDAIGDEDEYEVELIFPLPGHTYKTFAKDIANLMDRPLAIPRVYYGLVLPNSEMANESYREKYGLQMAQIPYNFMWVNGYRMSNDGRVMEEYECEVADVIISTKDMDEDETKKAWMFLWIAETFFWYGFSKNNTKLSNYEYYTRLQDYIINSDGFLNKLYCELLNEMGTCYWAHDLQYTIRATNGTVEKISRKKHKMKKEIKKFLETL